MAPVRRRPITRIIATVEVECLQVSPSSAAAARLLLADVYTTVASPGGQLTFLFFGQQLSIALSKLAPRRIRSERRKR